MKKKIFLHIGQYKTGSSSIQNFLVNQDVFLSKNGFKYCKTGLSFDEPEVGIRHYLLYRNTNSKSCLWPQLVREIINSSEHSFIISSEAMLSGLSLEQIAYIAEQLKKFDVRIICYLRRQDNLMNSWYAEHVKNHRCDLVFSDFVKKFGWLGNYGRALNHWTKSFPSAQIFVKSFENLKEAKVNVIDSFLSILNVGEDINFQNRRDNSSLGINSLMDMLAFNRNLNVNRDIHRGFAKSLISFHNQDQSVQMFDIDEAKTFISSFEKDFDILKRILPHNKIVFSNEFKDKNKPNNAFLGEVVSQMMVKTLPKEKVSEVQVDMLRDISDTIEDQYPLEALELMGLAHLQRPQGEYIKKRLKEIKCKMDKPQ